MKFFLQFFFISALLLKVTQTEDRGDSMHRKRKWNLVPASLIGWWEAPTDALLSSEEKDPLTVNANFCASPHWCSTQTKWKHKNQRIGRAITERSLSTLV